jgi:hypothetical protein
MILKPNARRVRSVGQKTFTKGLLRSSFMVLSSSMTGKRFRIWIGGVVLLVAIGISPLWSSFATDFLLTHVIVRKDVRWYGLDVKAGSELLIWFVSDSNVLVTNQDRTASLDISIVPQGMEPKIMVDGRCKTARCSDLQVRNLNIHEREVVQVEATAESDGRTEKLVYSQVANAPVVLRFAGPAVEEGRFAPTANDVLSQLANNGFDRASFKCVQSRFPATQCGTLISR